MTRVIIYNLFVIAAMVTGIVLLYPKAGGNAFLLLFMILALYDYSHNN